MRRTISAVALVLVVTLAALAGSGGVPSSPAEAHGGPRTYRLDAGPYRVLAQVSRSGDAIDETLTVKEAATGHALTAGIVTVALRRAGSEPGRRRTHGWRTGPDGHEAIPTNRHAKPGSSTCD